MLVVFIIIVSLIILSACFSGSETALTAVSRDEIHKLEQGNNPKAKLASWLLARQEQLISTILLGNNLVNIAASALATSLAIKLFGEEGVFLATIVMTLMIFVFAEVLPKTFALQNSLKVALIVSPVFAVLVKIFTPFNMMVQWIVNRAIRFFRFDKTGNNDLISATDALRGAIALRHQQGDVKKQDKDMLGGILDLSDMTVGEIMTHRKKMIAYDVNMPPKQMAKAILSSGHTRFPIWESEPDNIVAVLHSKDLFSNIYEKDFDEDSFNINDILNDPWFVPETTRLKEQLLEFRNKRKHFAIVVDEYGDLMGVITLEDILEEIVGQIEDEHDQVVSGVVERRDGSFVVHGELAIRDLNRQYEWHLPDDNAATIAGLIIYEAQYIPSQGEIIEAYDLKFEILRKIDNQLVRIRIIRD